MALRELAESAPLRTLKLHGCWPISPVLFGGDVEFRCLKDIDIECAPITYDGRWYYTGDPSNVEAGPPELDIESSDDGDDDGEEDDDEEDDDGVHDTDSSDSEDGDNLNRIRESFLNGDFPKHIWRTQLDTELINPVVKTLAAAVLRMPNFKKLYFAIGLGGHLAERSIFLECLRPLQISDIREEALFRNRWYVTSMRKSKWKVPSDLEHCSWTL